MKPEEALVLLNGMIETVGAIETRMDRMERDRVLGILAENTKKARQLTASRILSIRTRG